MDGLRRTDRPPGTDRLMIRSLVRANRRGDADRIINANKNDPALYIELLKVFDKQEVSWIIYL